MATLDGIYVYPIKSLDGRAVEAATISPGGSLHRDRQYAIVDDDGEYVNGKRTPQVHRISAEFGPGASIVTLGGTDRFDLESDRDSIETWLDRRLDPDVSLVQDGKLGYPDDTTAHGPTVIATGTLETIAGWFDAIDGPVEMRRRLRPNLVVDAEPFWEDRLYAGPDDVVRFDVGDVTFEGTGPCRRCVVPTRDPDTGEPIDGFKERFVERRRATLPSWAEDGRFEQYYRVMTNTRTPEESRGEIIAVGDEVVPVETMAAER